MGRIKMAVVECLKHWRCVLTHKEHWFYVHGLTLCRVCDAHLLDRIIQSAPPVDNALNELAACADAGLRGSLPNRVVYR